MLTEQEALAIAQQAIDETKRYPHIEEFRLEKTFVEDDGWTFQFHVIYDNITDAMPFQRVFIDKATGEASPPKTRLLTEQEALSNAEKMNMVSFKRRLQHLTQKGLDAEAHHYEKGYSWSLRHTYENETTWIFNYKLILQDATIDPPFKDISIDKRTGAIPL